MSSSLVSIWLIVVFLFAVASTANVDPDRVHFIDYLPESGNYLFRTGLPLNDTTFAYDDLKVLFASVAKSQAGLTLPDDYLMLDISLLSFEIDQIKNESDFFSANPSLGSFVLWPTFGSLVDPMKVTAVLRKLYAEELEHVTHDDVPSKMTELRAMLEKQYEKPTVVFLHCDAGMDRTGEMSGSYYITYQNMSFAQAMTIDDTINRGDLNRSIMCENRNAFQWYCLHTMYDGQYSRDNCTVPANLPQCSYAGTSKNMKEKGKEEEQEAAKVAYVNV